MGTRGVSRAGRGNSQAPAGAGFARRRRASRGQAMVEFALVLMPLLLMMFGIVEFSLITSSIGAYNFAAKDAARLGTLLGRTSDTVDQQMLAVIHSHTDGMVAARILKVEIFQSDMTGAISSVADVYDGNDAPIGTPQWPPSLRDDSLLSADYLGVRITYQYTYLTALLSGSAPNLTLTALSVQRIEPQDYQSYRHPTPPASVSGTSPSRDQMADLAAPAMVERRGKRVSA